MKKILLSIALFTVSFATTAQVGIGTNTPEGALDVVSTNSGVVVPRVANTAAVNNPVNGMLIYDLSTDCLKVFVGGVWSDCFGQNAAVLTAASNAALAQIGNEADDPDTINSGTTIADLNAILPTVTGIQSTKETSYQNYIDGNPALFSSPATQAEVQAMMDAISATDVVGPTGKIWMDRNLGASQVATSSTDAASYGDLYQWGRTTDGHEKRNATVVAGPVASGSEGANFITSGTTPNDWLSAQDDTRWGATKTANDPCPTGYRVPTETELNAERLLFATNDAAGAFGSVLKLPVAGNRYFITGAFTYVGTYGTYWSSTIGGTDARYLYFSSSNTNMYSYHRADGYSVRCIKD